MTINEVLCNIFAKMYSYRLILLECYISNDNNTVTNSITVETLSDIARIRLNNNNFQVLESHFLKNPEDVEDKLKWMLKTNDLKVNAIGYIIMNEHQDTLLDAFSINEELIYSFYTIRDMNTTKFSYKIFSDDVDETELISDYKNYIDILKKEKPHREVVFINDPIQDFRVKKLMEIGID